MTQALDTLSHSDCYFEDNYEPYQLSDGAIVGHVIYFEEFSDTYRQAWETQFLEAWDNSRSAVVEDPNMINLICELNKTLNMAQGRGFTVEELNRFADQDTRREWIKEAIKSEEYQKEILLDLYVI